MDKKEHNKESLAQETEIILVRHGLTASNEHKRIMGWLDEGLSEAGQKQAKLLGRRLRDWRIHHFFTSPLSRARQTCTAITQHHKAQAEIIEDFGEIHVTLWQGLSWHQIVELYPRQWKLWRTNPAQLNASGLESLASVRKRVAGELNRIIEAHRGKTILIAGHDSVIRVAIFHLVGLDNSYYRSFPVKNASISIVKVSPLRAELMLFNDVSHLDGQNSPQSSKKSDFTQR